MVKCLKCGKDNRDGARFCSRCATPLQGAAPSAPAAAPILEVPDYYALLGLAPDAPPDQVQQALHDAARAEHAPISPEQLGDAITLLTDPAKRAEYDRKRLAWQGVQRLKKADLASNDLYRRLGVSRFARRREIQAAFACLAHLHTLGRVSRGGLRRLEEAHAQLANPNRRRQYDLMLDSAQGPDQVTIPHEINYYDYLGLDRGAKETQIREADAALRGPLTLKAKGGDQSAEETLKQLNLIIQTLTDENKRKEYDADPAHDVFRFQTSGRPEPSGATAIAARAARFAAIESIVYGPGSDGLEAYGGLWPDDVKL
jgi:DnaJ-class molecular chaperone